MGLVRARVDVPARVSEAEALWYDHRRWPTFVDGLQHVEAVEGDWPAAGARLTWRSARTGLVAERVLAYEARVGQTVEVADARIHGQRRVAFVALGDAARIELELRYVPVSRRLAWPPVDLVLVRRGEADALARTLRRFATELKAERDPGL